MTRIGRYEIVGLLGQGGMGKVHLGFDRSLGRYVAVKQITSNVMEHPENATLLAYFEREARVIASLQHPNIIQIYDYAAPAGESAWIATEFVDGVTFEELSDDVGPMPARASLALLHPVAEALGYAHERGIIHRDLKPGNVMLSRHGRVYLMDFGLAKPMESSSLKSMVIGSPAFMAPEQVEGSGTDVRTDVFAFGLLAYALATGELFFSATVARAFAEIMGPDYRVRDKVQNISDPLLASLIEGCVQRDPRERFQTMQPVIDGLERALQSHGSAGANRELRDWSERWADLMPQQFTRATVSEGGLDTTPASAPDFSPTMPALELPSGFRGRDPGRPAPIIEFGADVAVSDNLSDEPDTRSSETEAMERLSAALPVARAVSDDDVTMADEPLFDAQPGYETAPELAGAARVVVLTAEPTPVQAPPEPAAPAPDPDSLALLADRLQQLDHPDGSRRLLLLLASSGGALDFGTLRTRLLAISPDTDMHEVSALLAALVGGAVLVQRGEDQIALSEDVTAGAVCALVRSGPEPAEVLPTTIAEAMNTASQLADESLDPEAAAQVLDRALSWTGMAAGLAPTMVHQLRIQRAGVASRVGDLPRARGLLKTVIAAASAGPRQKALARLRLAHVCLDEGLPLTALSTIEAGLEARSQPDAGGHSPEQTAWLASVRARIYLRQGRLEEARRDVDTALAAGGVGQHLEAFAALYLIQAALLRSEGRLADAESVVVSLIDQLEDAGDIQLLARAQTLSTRLALDAGDLDAAEDRVMQARGNARAASAGGVLFEVGLLRSELCRLRGDFAGALDHAERALADTSVVPMRQRARGSAVHGCALLAAGRLSEARTQADLAAAGLASEPEQGGLVALLQARLARANGDFASARRDVSDAARSASDCGFMLPAAWLVLSKLAFELGDAALGGSARRKAVRVYAESGRTGRFDLDDRDLA